MILVFFILIITGIVTLIILSTISIRVEKVELSNYNLINKFTYDYEIYLELLFLNRIKIFSNKINKAKVSKLNNKFNLKNKIKNVNMKEIKGSLPSKEETKQILKKLQIRLSKLNLKLELGTEDVIITAGIIAIISSLLGVVLSRIIKKFNKDKYKYEIYPIYEDKNLIKLNLNCIIKVKIVHIIYVIYVLLKKRRVDKHERTSNRRSYDYSYE